MYIAKLREVPPTPTLDADTDDDNDEVDNYDDEEGGGEALEVLDEQADETPAKKAVDPKDGRAGKYVHPDFLQKPFVNQPHPLIARHADQPVPAPPAQDYPFFAVLPPAVWDVDLDRSGGDAMIVKFTQVGGYGACTINYEFMTRTSLYSRMNTKGRYNRSNVETKASIRYWSMAGLTTEQVKAKVAAGNIAAAPSDDGGFVHQKIRYLVVPCTPDQAAAFETMEEVKYQARKDYEQTRDRSKNKDSKGKKKGKFAGAAAVLAKNKTAKVLAEATGPYEKARAEIKKLVAAFMLVLESQEFTMKGDKAFCRTPSCNKSFTLSKTKIATRIIHLWWWHHYLPQPIPQE